MKKFVSLFLLITGVLFSTACTKDQVKEQVNQIACKAETSIINSTVNEIAAQLECTGLDAIRVDVAAQVERVGLCKEDTQQPQDQNMVMAIISVQPICNLVGAGMVSQLAQKIPTEWNCTAENAQARLNQAVLDGCAKVFAGK